MAKESAISKLGAKPLGFKLGVLGGAILVLGLGYWQFFYSSLEEDLKGKEGSYKRLEKKNKNLKKREKEWKQMIKDKEELDLMLSTNQVALPRSAALPSFIGHLQRQAAVAGVSFKNWSREAEEPVTGFIKVPISVEVIGSFHQLLKYFYLLGDPEKTKRIITVENFSIKRERHDTDEVLLRAKFRATTFRQDAKDVDLDTVGKEEDKPKNGMIEKAKDAKAKKEGQLENATGIKAGGEEGGATPSGMDRLKNPGAN